MVAKWLKLGIGAIEAAIDARKMRTAAPVCGGLKREGERDREGEGERQRRRERTRERDTDRGRDVTDLLPKKGELRARINKELQ